MILKHHFTNWHGEKVSAYWYDDRYRYTVTTDKGIEYRERVWLYPFESYTELERILNEDIVDNPYGDQQLKSKCIRCSKWHGSPRKEYNLAPICNRCEIAMHDTSNVAGNTEYEINSDGSKGNVIRTD